MADLSEEGDRTRYFGYFTAALSMGFVFGPLLGGYLGDPEGAAWTGPSTAFYVAGALNALAVLGFVYFFAETLDEDDRDDEGDFAVGQSLANAREAFRDEARRPYYLTLLCYIGGYTFFMTFYAVVLEERLDMDAQQTGWFFSALGLALMLVQLLLVDRLEKWLGPDKLLWAAMFSVAGATAALGLATAPWMAYVAIVPFALASGLIDPMIMSLLSRSAEGRSAGPRPRRPWVRRLDGPRAPALPRRSDRGRRGGQLGRARGGGPDGGGGRRGAALPRRGTRRGRSRDRRGQRRAGSTSGGTLPQNSPPSDCPPSDSPPDSSPSPAPTNAAVPWGTRSTEEVPNAATDCAESERAR